MDRITRAHVMQSILNPKKLALLSREQFAWLDGADLKGSRQAAWGLLLHLIASAHCAEVYAASAKRLLRVSVNGMGCFGIQPQWNAGNKQQYLREAHKIPAALNPAAHVKNLSGEEPVGALPLAL